MSTVLGNSNHVLDLHRELFPDAVQATMPPPMKPIVSPPPAAAEPAAGDPRLHGFAHASPRASASCSKRPPGSPNSAWRYVWPVTARSGANVERAEHVRYEGQLEGTALAEFISECDAGIVPSLWNEPGGGPFVLGEWLGARRPVLTTRRGGLAEVEGKGGTLSFGASVADLIAAAARLRDEATWRELIASLPVVDADADLDRWLDRHVAIYERAIESQAHPTPAQG